MPTEARDADRDRPGAWARGLGFFVENGLVVAVLVGLLVAAGVATAPFDWQVGGFPRDPVPVDAIPDVGDNQQIVFTEWPGRSPRDVEDQVTYPLTTALLGIPGVETIRSSSAFGFSSIYLVFEEGVDFYWSRSRVLEKLAALPAGTLPGEVRPQLGPDATGLGQVFWYTLEGHGPDGGVVGGWDLHELRTIQDWTVRYALQAVPGVAEVASVGGHVEEIQVDVDPDALLGHGVTLDQVADAVRRSNLDVGARTLEINRVEYVVRGLGFLDEAADLEEAVVGVSDNTPIRIGDVGRVGLGPAQRRGALDDAGAEVVGGVVVTRVGANPMEVLDAVRAKIREIAPGLPRRALDDGSTSQVTIVPFYDRSTLIQETLGTLSTALVQQLLVTVLVVLVILRRLRSALLVSAILPLSVLGAFVAMKVTRVDANVMALAGIAIAIGSMVDVGIVFVENVVAALDDAGPGADRVRVIRDAAGEVAPAVVTSVLTTVVSFLPVFGLVGPAGRLFRPLAFTKTYAMGIALLLALMVIPALARLVLRPRPRAPGRWRRRLALVEVLVAGAVVTWWLTRDWMPLGLGTGWPVQLVFVVVLLGGFLGVFAVFGWAYPAMLRAALDHKGWAVGGSAAVVVAGLLAWLGVDGLFGWLPEPARETGLYASVEETFPGLGREDMPPFDEGSYLYMPTTMPHASIGQALEMMQRLDAAIAEIPEVDRVVGKLGRADTALDPAPVSMFEVVVTYLDEFRTGDDGQRVRQWRDHIRSPDDIWSEIRDAAALPGLTGAPRLMPIETRLVMLRSGMRAPMGVRVRGPDLETIQAFALAIERQLRDVPSIDAGTVQTDRILGKPYLEVDIDRTAIGRYGLDVEDVQSVLEIAQGGRPLTRTVEGRERTPVRVRYMREERSGVDELRRLVVPAPTGQQIPLGQLAEIRYAKGPQAIKSEDTFPVAYVTFGVRREDGEPVAAEAAVVEEARRFLEARLAAGDLEIPDGASYAFAGTYEDLLETEARLSVLVPVALALVFLILYLQFRRVSTTVVIFGGVVVAVACGFLLLWLYGRPGFLDFSVLDRSMATLFGVGTVNLSVAVWVGIIALVGIATDNGVVLATYLAQRSRVAPTRTRAEIRERAFEGGMRRLRPCLMTTATTVLALLPVITSQGRGADVMRPMALPVMGGMAGALMTLILVPVLYAWVDEVRLARGPGH